MHGNSSDNLLANEVSDLDLEQTRLLVLLQVDVDGEMGIDVSHLVLEALGDTGDQVLDDGADGAEGGNIFTVAVVDLDGDGVLLGVTEVDSQVTEVLGELAYKPPVLETNFPDGVVVESAVQEVVLKSDWRMMVFRTSGTLDSDDTGLDADLDYSQKKIICQLHHPWNPSAAFPIDSAVCFPSISVVAVCFPIAVCTSPRDRE